MSGRHCGSGLFFGRKKLGLKTAVITGSNGKTTAKHFCQIFFQDDPSVICSPESYNNELGVSLSILRAGLQTKILIQEMGANHPGEIEQLCRLAEPDVAVCTLVSPAHLKGFGSIEKISLEKEQIYLAHPAEFAIFNLDNPYTKAMKSRYKGHLPALTFSSQNKTADIFLQPAQEKENSFTVRGHIQGKKNSCRIPLAGVHNLTSVMTAVGVSLALGKNPEELWQKLPQLKTPDQRCQFIDGGDNVQIFFDAYNSNPQSMSAFIDHIALLNKKTPCVVCLGDMLELGDQSSFFHKELGEKTARLPIAYLFYIGRYRHDFEQGLKQAQFKGRYELFEQYDSKCRKRMASVLKPFSCFALKASRGLYFERIINDLKST